MAEWWEDSPVVTAAIPPNSAGDEGNWWEKAPEVQSKSGAEYAEGVARAIAQGLTAGYGDEIAGVLGKVGNTLGRAAGMDIPEQTYKSTRDAVRADDTRFTQEHPVEAIGGRVAGSMVVPGGAMKLLGGGLGTAVSLGAAGGGLSGAGNAEEMKDVPVEVLKGAALGGGATAGAAAVIRGAQAALPSASEYAQIFKLPLSTARKLMREAKEAPKVDISTFVPKAASTQMATPSARDLPWNVIEKNPIPYNQGVSDAFLDKMHKGALQLQAEYKKKIFADYLRNLGATSAGQVPPAVTGAVDDAFGAPYQY